MLHTKLDTSIEIVADKLRITQVLGNIVGNAIKFTRTGNITVETHVYVKENKVEIRIIDTGSGIPDYMLTNLFDKFSTKKSTANDSQSGTGLGLFISKAIVLAHDGQLYASNNNVSGSTFSIILPIDGNKKEMREE